MDRPTPDCSHCEQIPRGYLTDDDGFPDAWRPLSGHPRIEPGSWLASGRKGPWLFCEACETIWYVFFNPKDMYYSDIVPIAEVFWPVLQPHGALDDVLAVVLDEPDVLGGRFYGGWISSWFNRAHFDRRAAIERLLEAMLWDGLTAEHAARLLGYVRAVIGHLDAAQATSSKAEQSLFEKAAGVFASAVGRGSDSPEPAPQSPLSTVDFRPIAHLADRQDIFEAGASHERSLAEKRMRKGLADFLQIAPRRGIDLDPDVEHRLRRATSPERVLHEALGRIRGALRADDPRQLAEAMHDQYLAIEEHLVKEEFDATADIRDLRPVLEAMHRLGEGFTAHEDPPSRVASAVERYRVYLQGLVARGDIERADMVEVLEGFAPHRISYYRPEHLASHPATTSVGCRTCRRASPPTDASAYVTFPKAWSNIHEHPDVQPGSWATPAWDERIHFCASCGAFWFSYLSPDGGTYEHRALPPACSTIIDYRATAQEVVEFIASPTYAAHRIVGPRRLCWRYFEQGYGAREATEPLLEALADGSLSDAQRLDLLRFLDLTMRVLLNWAENYRGQTVELPQVWARALDPVARLAWSANQARATAVELAAQIRAAASRIAAADR